MNVLQVINVTAVPRVTIQMDLTYASVTAATQETDELVEVETLNCTLSLMLHYEQVSAFVGVLNYTFYIVFHLI